MNKRLLWGLLLFNAVALPALYVMGHPKFTHGAKADAATLADYGVLPDFELVRENGSNFGSRDMKGSLWVADFIFTRCPNMCPAMSAKFAVLQDRVPEGVKLASFSVDPANDTPEAFKKYAGNYGAKSERWAFVTGDAEPLKKIKEAAHTGNGDDPSLHSLRFVLLDKALHLRGYYDSTESDWLKKIQSDIERLRKEK